MNAGREERGEGVAEKDSGGRWNIMWALLSSIWRR